MIQIVNFKEDESMFISEEGFKFINKIYNKEDPGKYLRWTDDYKQEMPIFI
jgi:hypothetical protein